MNEQEILSRVDHTLLKAVASWEEVKKLCEEAIQYHTASVCIPPSFVGRVRAEYGSLRICTVIGFPLGYHTTQAKVYEAEQAVREGADEIDMVINLGDVKEGRFDKVTGEIQEMKQAVGEHILKVIIETCYLTGEEKLALCHCVTEGGADFIKTSTGFGTDGAKLADVWLFKENIGPGVKIKAAGGIRDREELEKFVEAGCSRIGTSSAVKILRGERGEAY